MKHSRLSGACCACIGLLFSTLSCASVVSGQGTWETTLLPRNLEGNPDGPAVAYYDTARNIT